jgi:hypothetical protein
VNKGIVMLVLSGLPLDQFWDVAERFVYSHPAPYDCIISPRFPEVVSILTEEQEIFEN